MKTKDVQKKVLDALLTGSQVGYVSLQMFKIR